MSCPKKQTILSHGTMKVVLLSYIRKRGTYLMSKIVHCKAKLNILTEQQRLPFNAQEDTGVPFHWNYNSILRRDHQKNFLWASRLWVGRRKESILGYVPKNGEKNLVHKGLRTTMAHDPEFCAQNPFHQHPNIPFRMLQQSLNGCIEGQ